MWLCRCVKRHGLFAAPGSQLCPLSQAGMWDVSGWILTSLVEDGGDRGRRLQLWRNWLNIHFERALLQTRGATKDRERKRRAAKTASLQWHWLNLWAFQNREDPVFKYPYFPRAKHAPISSSCTKLGFLTLDYNTESYIWIPSSSTEKATAGNKTDWAVSDPSSKFTVQASWKVNKQGIGTCALKTQRYI